MELMPIENKELLPWHRPQVSRLVVTVATQFSTGSFEDCSNQAGTSPVFVDPATCII